MINLHRRFIPGSGAYSHVRRWVTCAAVMTLSTCRSTGGIASTGRGEAQPDSGVARASSSISRPYSAIAEGTWRILVQSQAITRELSAASSPTDSMTVALVGRLLVRLQPDSAILDFSPDSASTRSAGRVRIPRTAVHRQLPAYRVVQAAGSSSGTFVNPIQCSEARGDQLVSGFLPLPLLLPASSLRQEWVDSTHALVCIGPLPVTMLIISRYSARAREPASEITVLDLQRISTLTAVTTSPMDSLAVDVRLTGTSTGQTSLSLGSSRESVLVTDTVRTELSFRSPHVQQRFEQQAIRSIRLLPDSIRR